MNETADEGPGGPGPSGSVASAAVPVATGQPGDPPATAHASAGAAEPAGPGTVVGVLAETAPGERRVSLVPGAVAKLAESGLSLLVESGAGDGAFLTDEAYSLAGAAVTSRDDVLARADVVAVVGKPTQAVVERLREGQALIGMLQPLTDPTLAAVLASRGVTAISLDGLPRTLSRAQSMDALTSQANIAGYKAVLVAASTFARYFPLLITASGTAKPANVLVLGAGVAGLQAMGTAKRLGAVVLGYDVRPETRLEIQSVGARFLELGAVGEGAGEGGYARALSPEELAAQQEAMAGHIARQDVVITTAQVPGRRPPLLVTDSALKAMRPGSIVIDLAASPLGGNVEGSRPDETVVTGNGVTVIGAGNLPSTVPGAASDAFSHNVVALLAHLARGGSLTVDLDDEIQSGVVITHGGRVVHRATAALLQTGTDGGSQ